MKGTERLTQLALAAALAVTSAGAHALTADPTGDWSGTIKCTGVSSDVGKSSSTASASVIIDGDTAFVVALVQPYITYSVAYVPDAGNPANKGTLGYFATPDFSPWHETGQANLVRGKDGKVTLDGKSYVVLLPGGSVTSGLCEWKLGKTSDVPSPPPI